MAPGEVSFVEENLAVLLSLSPDGGVDGGVGYGIEREEGSMISSRRPRSSSDFCTKLGYISFNAAELNAGANIHLCHQPALKHWHHIWQLSRR